MTEGVQDQEIATPDKSSSPSDKELNFRRLEALRDSEREGRIRAEIQAESLKAELNRLAQSLVPPEKDPLDDAEEYVDSTRLKQKLAQERAASERRAKEIAKETYEHHRLEDEKKNYLNRLRLEFRDFDDVMTPESIGALEKNEPSFVKAVKQIPDDYEKCKLAYEHLKGKAAVPQAPRQSIKETVEENARNPYYIPPGSGNPSAVEFDIRSKEAREQAYAKLKAAQRRPLQGGGPSLAH